MQDSLAVATSAMEQPIMDLISVAGAFGGSMLLGLVKKYTSILDGKIGTAVKPVQPILIGAAALGLPYLTSALGIAPIDPTVFVTAPSAALLAISTREAVVRLRKKVGTP